MLRVFVLLWLYVLSGYGVANTDLCDSEDLINQDDWEAIIHKQVITFIAQDLRTNTCWLSHRKRVLERHTPWSTFKIPHSLIALQTGAVKHVDETIAWDTILYPSEDYWPKSWRKDQTLATAFKRSAHWFYQALVPRISYESYQHWLHVFNYGNQAVQKGQQDFWLGKGLKISAKEQLNFINCLVSTDCGLSAQTIERFESIALQQNKQSYALFAKTGAGPLVLHDTASAYEGWYMGYVRDSEQKPVASFALYMQGKTYNAIKDARQELSLQLLSYLNLWPK